MNKEVTNIPRLASRQADSHKGDYGRVLVVGGNKGMIGAPALAARAAFRSGAGLVRIATAHSIQLNVAQLVPCATSIPLPEDGSGQICRQASIALISAIEEHDSVAIGPGMGQSAELQGIVEKVVKECRMPMVIDADGLNNLARLGDRVKLSDNTVLTPHPGEMDRLWLGWMGKKAMPDDRVELAEEFSAKVGAVVVLKGSKTVIACSTGTYINTTGNPGMATGGSGDVLTGCIAGLMARLDEPLSAFDAAVLGVYVHGRAGDLAAAALTETAVTAEDLVDYLGSAWGSVEEEQGQ